MQKGQIINEFTYCPKSHEFIENILFNELRNNFEQYEFHFKMMNLELIDKMNYFYLLDEDSLKNDKQRNKNKILASIIIFVRYITLEGDKLRDSIENINYGVDESDFEGIVNNNAYVHLLQKARIDNGTGVIKVLFERNLLIKTNRGKYILSDSGKAIVGHIIDTHTVPDI